MRPASAAHASASTPSSRGIAADVSENTSPRQMPRASGSLPASRRTQADACESACPLQTQSFSYRMSRCKRLSASNLLVAKPPFPQTRASPMHEGSMLLSAPFRPRSNSSGLLKRGAISHHAQSEKGGVVSMAASASLGESAGLRRAATARAAVTRTIKPRTPL